MVTSIRCTFPQLLTVEVPPAYSACANSFAVTDPEMIPNLARTLGPYNYGTSSALLQSKEADSTLVGGEERFLAALKAGWTFS